MSSSTAKILHSDYNPKDSSVVNINFVCQRCSHPLKIDSSFNCLDDHMYSDLTAPFVASTDSNVSFPPVDHLDTNSKQSLAGQNIETLLFSDTDSDSSFSSDEVEQSTSSNENYEEDELTDVIAGEEESTDEDMVKVSRKYIPPAKLSGSNNGFMLVGGNAGSTNCDESCSVSNINDDYENSTRTNVIKMPQPSDIKNTTLMIKLFDIMSDQSDIDHPLCEECTDALLNYMDQQLEVVEKECDDYKSLCDEERELEKQLEQLEDEQIKLEEEEIRLKKEQTRISAEHEHYWKRYYEYKRQAISLSEKYESIENQMVCAQTHLEKLKKTNVFNATFHIWHDGPFGTINNLRLGRLPDIPVEWNEINAAWGQTTLLLHSLAKKVGLQFKKCNSVNRDSFIIKCVLQIIKASNFRYKLVPYGSHSYVKVLSDNSELPLYGSGGFKFFWENKLDAAMSAFLDCLQQFKEHAEKFNESFSLPYKMEKGRIIDSKGKTYYMIKVQFNSEEQWTKALKFLLTNLKWALAWAASPNSSQ
ncbi:Beclin-1 [Nymphon striatum]|nr:Beclin-1 [Nymphon striatum]